MTDYAPLFEHMADQPYGIEIETNNPQRLQVVLSEWQREHLGMGDFRICVPSEPGLVWIVHANVELPE